MQPLGLGLQTDLLGPRQTRVTQDQVMEASNFRLFRAFSHRLGIAMLLEPSPGLSLGMRRGGFQG